MTTRPVDLLKTATDLDKGHGRIEERTVTVSSEIDWLAGERHFPGAGTLIRVEAKVELTDHCRIETHYFISSAILDADPAAVIMRGHWSIENALHWTFDVIFGDDQARLGKGHGAHNMAIVRHFAINLVRSLNDKRSIELRRKRAGWHTAYLETILGNPPRLPGFAALG